MPGFSFMPFGCDPILNRSGKEYKTGDGQTAKNMRTARAAGLFPPGAGECFVPEGCYVSSVRDLYQGVFFRNFMCLGIPAA